MTKEDMDELTGAISSLDIVPNEPRVIKSLPCRVNKRVSARVIKPLFRRINDQPGLLALCIEAALSSTHSEQTVQPKHQRKTSQNFNSIPTTAIQPRTTNPLPRKSNKKPGLFNSEASSPTQASEEWKIAHLPQTSNTKSESNSSNTESILETMERNKNRRFPLRLFPPIPDLRVSLAPPKSTAYSHVSQPQDSSHSRYLGRITRAKAAATAHVVIEKQLDKKREKLLTAARILGFKKYTLELERPELAVEDFDRQHKAWEDKVGKLSSQIISLKSDLRSGIEQTPEMMTLRAQILQTNLCQSPIMRLSSEIRISIFKHAIGRTLIHVSSDGFGICNALERNLLRETFDVLNCRHLHEHTPSDRFEWLGALPDLAILRVCRQFYNDAWDIPFKQYLFDMRCVNDFLRYLTPLYSSMDTTPTLNLSRIRRLCIQFTHETDSWSSIPGPKKELELWRDFCVSSSRKMTSLRELRVGFALIWKWVTLCTLDHEWVLALLNFRQPNLTVVELIPYTRHGDLTKIPGAHEKLTAFSRDLERMLLTRD